MKKVISKVVLLISMFFFGCDIQGAEVAIQQQEIIEQYIEIFQNDKIAEKEFLELMQQDAESTTFFDLTVDVGFVVLATMALVALGKCIDFLDKDIFRYRPPGTPHND